MLAKLRILHFDLEKEKHEIFAALQYKPLYNISRSEKWGIRLLNEVQIHGLMCIGVIVFTIIIFHEVTLSYTLNPLFYLMYYE